MALGNAGISNSVYTTGYEPSKAFDNNSGTFYFSAGGLGAYFGVDFGAGVTHDLAQFTYRCESGTGASGPFDIQVDFSDDGAAWTNVIGFDSLSWTAGETKTFNVAAPPAVEIRTTEVDVLIAGTAASIELRLSSGYALTAVNFPTPAERTSGLEGLVTVKNDIPLRVTEAVVLVAVKLGAESHQLRAWTFTQDDHDFYVLGLGTLYPTLVLDLLTNQWSEWNTEGLINWRTSTGMAWDYENIAGDLTEGIIWNISADERRDDFSSDIADARPIISIVRGMFPVRLRNALGCYRADLTLSEFAPAQVGVGITLRTSDDYGHSWQDHGFRLFDDVNTFYEISWASLGIMTQPGRIFEIEDSGVAARIDALDIDLGPDEGKVSDGA